MVRAIPAPGAGALARSFFDKTNDWARSEGYAGLGYINIKEGNPGGPIAKNLGEEKTTELITQLGLGDNDGVFFACDKADGAAKLAGVARTRVGEQLELISEGTFEFCWIVDYPMFELDEESGKIEFSHNPFSMPQGGLDALESKDPLDVLAFQYDIVVVWVGAFCRCLAHRDVRSMKDRIAKTLKPSERGLFDDGFSK